MTDRSVPEAAMARQLLAGWRWFDDGLRAGLSEARFGEITTSHSMIFPYLGPDGTRPAALARRLGMSRQGLQQLVAGLVDQGLVEQHCFDTLERQLADHLGEGNTAKLRALLARAWP